MKTVKYTHNFLHKYMQNLQRGRMKYIFLNLKRFDVTKENGGVNALSVPENWGAYIATELQSYISKRRDLQENYEFSVFFPEAHIISAAKALSSQKNQENKGLQLGCQSVYHQDVATGGNFGAFTTLRTAKSMKQLGCTWTIIGHSEEKKALREIMILAGATPENITKAIHTILNKEIQQAQNAGLKVLYCIGESQEEVPYRLDVLKNQIEAGLEQIDASSVVLGYEPLWAIGPGKIPPTAEEIASIVKGIKTFCPCPVVYGGGLKKDNAESIGAITELDGGLIALTRFSGDIGFYPEEYAEIVEKYVTGF